MSWYFARRVPLAAAMALASSLRGRLPEAAEMAMEAAYALGSVAQRVTSRVARMTKATGVVIISGLALSGSRGLETGNWNRQRSYRSSCQCTIGSPATGARKQGMRLPFSDPM